MELLTDESWEDSVFILDRFMIRVLHQRLVAAKFHFKLSLIDKLDIILECLPFAKI